MKQAKKTKKTIGDGAPAEKPEEKPKQAKKKPWYKHPIMLLVALWAVLGLFGLSSYSYGEYGCWFGPFSNQHTITLPDGYSDYMTPIGQDEDCRVFGGPGMLIAEEVEDGFVLVGYARSPVDRAENECSSRDEFVLSLSEWNYIPRNIDWYLERQDREHRRRAMKQRFRR